MDSARSVSPPAPTNVDTEQRVNEVAPYPVNEHIKPRTSGDDDGISTVAVSAPLSPSDDAVPSAEDHSVFSQVYLGWLYLVLTIAAFVLTVFYAVSPGTFSRMSYVNDSISHSIRTLRLLSGITDIQLSMTCFAAFERLQLMLVSKEAGMSLLKMLLMHPSTGYAGLAALTFGKGPPDLAVRFMATGRLLIMVLSAILGIVIMSDVHTQPAVDYVSTWELPNAEGISEFNTTGSYLAALQADRIFSNSMTNFLSSNEIAIDVTPDKLRSMSCQELATDGRERTCERTVFMPGSIPIGVVTRGGHPDADIAVTFAVKGYVLLYEPGDTSTTWEFDEAECRTWGMDWGAARFCLSNSHSNTLKARLVKCPDDVIKAHNCMTDDSWHTNGSEVTTTTLTTTYRWADIAYHRANASIAWHHELEIPEQEAPMRASDLLGAFDNFAIGSKSIGNLYLEWSAGANASPTANTNNQETTEDTLSDLSEIIDTLVDTDTGLNTSTSGRIKRQSINADLFDSITSLAGGALSGGIPGSTPIFPNLPFAYMQACHSLSAFNPGALSICTDFLQNMLAIPLYWCDNMLPLRANSGGLDLTGIYTQNAGDGIPGADLAGFLAYAGVDDSGRRRIEDGMGSTEVALARLRHEIVVGLPTLIAYIVCVGSILCFCITALAVGTWETTRSTLAPTPWPLLDFLAKMRTSVQERAVLQEDKHRLLSKISRTQKEALGQVVVSKNEGSPSGIYGKAHQEE